MTEQFTNRQESSRSLAEADLYRSLAALDELGVLQPLSGLDTYHGRVSDTSREDWTVDPNFNNGGDSTGNRNVSERPALYVGSKNLAHAYGEKRTTQAIYNSYITALPSNEEELSDATKDYFWDQAASKFSTEVHEIASNDTEARILNLYLDTNSLDPYQKAAYQDAIDGIIVSADELDFSNPADQEQAAKLKLLIKPNQYYSDEQINELAHGNGINPTLAYKVIGAENAKSFFKDSPMIAMDSLMSSNEDSFDTLQLIDGKEEPVTINASYLMGIFKKAHIVGAKVEATNSTINQPTEFLALLDLEKVDTVSSLEQKKSATAHELGEMALYLEGVLPKNTEGLAKLLIENPHAKPAEIMAAAKQVRDFDALSNLSLTENSTEKIGYFTEAALKSFDEKYADQIPVQMLAPMRLAILSSNLWRGMARYHQGTPVEMVKVSYAQQFLDELNITAELKRTVMVVVGVGRDTADRVDRQHDYSEQQYSEYAKQMVSFIKGAGEKVTDSEVDGIKAMSRMLSECEQKAIENLKVQPMLVNQEA